MLLPCLPLALPSPLLLSTELALPCPLVFCKTFTTCQLSVSMQTIVNAPSKHAIASSYVTMATTSRKLFHLIRLCLSPLSLFLPYFFPSFPLSPLSLLSGERRVDSKPCQLTSAMSLMSLMHLVLDPGSF